MKFRIIEDLDGNTCSELMLMIYRDNDGDDFVRLLAWHTDEEGCSMLQEMDLYGAESHETMENLIKDYSRESALEFINGFHV